MDTNMKTLGEMLVKGYPSNMDSMSNYAGSDYGFNFYHVYTRLRDSEIIDESNWEEILKLLGGEGNDNGVEIIRHGHWACGWVEYLLVDPTVTDSVRIAEDIVRRLKAYPILNEDDFSSREWLQAENTWKEMSLQDRFELCKSLNIPVLKIRHDYLPEDNDGSLLEWFTLK